jgi:hypothetical protein
VIARIIHKHIVQKKEDVMKIRVVALSLLLYSSGVVCFGQQTFFGTRSQALNGVRDLVGVESLIPRQYPGEVLWSKDSEAPCDKSYIVFSTAVEYDRSFKADRIKEFLFGCNNCMTVSGSRVPYRGANDILADYFGLPADFESTISFDPFISNVILDFNAFFGFDDFIPGLYFQMHVPMVHTKWDLRMCERVQEKGNDFQPAGYMGPIRLDRDQLAESASQYFAGNVTVGDMHDPLQFGKICGSRSLTQLAEVHATLGWNYVCQDDWHVGFGIRTAMKAWNGSRAEYLFEPIIGNCGHWELGGSITGHWDFWQNKTHKIAAYFDANITHLFGSSQIRSYDLNCPNGNGSRYMLLEYFNTPVVNLQNTDEQAPSSQYQCALAPVINHTTLESKISIGVQADIVLKFAYEYKNWEVDLGYNFFGRSKESCNERQCFPSNRFALKGDAQIYGFDSSQAIPLSVSQHEATIYAGQGATNFAAGAQFANANADNPAGAYNAIGLPLDQLTVEDSDELNIALENVNSSFNPVLLTDADINVCSGLLPKAISNKLFVNASYIWKDAHCIMPYVSGGVSAEWAGTEALENSAYSQWGFWVKGGITY